MLVKPNLAGANRLIRYVKAYRDVAWQMELRYLIRDVNVLKKTKKKTPITSLNPTDLSRSKKLSRRMRRDLAPLKICCCYLIIPKN